MRHAPTAFALALALTALTGCAVTDEALPAAQTDDALIASSGIDVRATYAEVPVGTWTYGYEPREPRVTVYVTVTDETLRQALPGFDGFERPFALVPRTEGAQVVWDRVELRWLGSTRRGYYGQTVVDEYITPGDSRLQVDRDTVLRLGVAIGMDTNVGTVWAQRPGQNHAVVPAQ